MEPTVSVLDCLIWAVIPYDGRTIGNSFGSVKVLSLINNQSNENSNISLSSYLYTANDRPSPIKILYNIGLMYQNIREYDKAAQSVQDGDIGLATLYEQLRFERSQLRKRALCQLQDFV
ncbi:unnamed protein product [Adineta steineri]|uniref:Uncharacterized protein n=1 Tax=Adineta steineri TaxID=433720 RepID=A0A819QY92_9BILA|nr:unnamed protein product [Adineta steineri]